jgi:hypothetical protein
MTPATKTKPRTGDEVARDLKRLRPQIERTEAKRRELYDRQNALYIEGHKAGLRATDMARAIGTPPEKIPSGAEAIRQVISRDGGSGKSR